jgi:hypothetical protein
MQSPKPDDDPGPVCACGRSRIEAAASIYRSHKAVFTFRRCACGREWTERLDGFDPATPITGDEVIEVHQALRRFKGPLSELLGLPRA